MTLNTPNLGIRWPRMTSKPFFLCHGLDGFILVYDLSRFEIFLILTPHDLKYPQVTLIPNLLNKKPLLGLKLQFELSGSLFDHFFNEIWWIWVLEISVFFQIFQTFDDL